MNKKAKFDKSSMPLPKPKYFCASNAPWGGFINIRMTEDLKERFFAWYDENANQVFALMIDMQAAGLKLTMSYDDENSCFIVTVTGALLADYPDRYCVTSRSGEQMQALALAEWKHFELARGDYDAYRPSSGGFGDFG